MRSSLIPIGSASYRVRNIGAKGNAAKSLTTYCLLLNINGFPISVVTTDMHGARASRRSDAIASDVSVSCKHINIVAEGLKIVGDSIARDLTQSVQIRSLDVGFLGQMTAKATWVPRAVACNATHVAVLMSASFIR